MVLIRRAATPRSGDLSGTPLPSDEAYSKMLVLSKRSGYVVVPAQPSSSSKSRWQWFVRGT